MVAQQKMKDNLSDTSSDSKPSAVSAAKSRLSMLKRSSTKQKAAAVPSNDPFRFHEKGVDFKGKLIGEKDVAEARGDQMCADAMKLVKAQVKAAGTHKQRVVLNVSIDGLKIRDEKTSMIVHNFPVSKISFIARDTTDARAFGFVFGTTDGKYKFYGIKTAQTADHAVLAIRDMFQVVFEMKKKQIEEVKQKKEEQENNENALKEDGIRVENGIRMADLIDLESELEHIAIGFNQLQNIPTMPEDSWPTTSDPFQSSSFNGAINTSIPSTNTGFFNDPFGSSFTVPHQNHQPSLFGNQPSTPTSNIWPATPQPITFSGSNPFLQGANPIAVRKESFPVFNPPINEVAQIQPQLPADPFDTHGLRQAITSIPQLSTLPLPPPVIAPPQVPVFSAQPLQTSNMPNFADFSVLNANQTKTEEKKVNIDELFNELIDTNVLMQKAPEQKKNPFEHIINPPKPSIMALASQNSCAVSTGNANRDQMFARSDPFNDEFFR